MGSTPNSTAGQSVTEAAPVAGWRWAPAWILAYVALWPAPGYAEAVLVLGALVAIAKLLMQRFRGGTRLLSHQAWALTGVLFAAYWLPELFSTFDAANRAHSLAQTVSDLRYLPFLWLAASAVASDAGRRTTFIGLAVIMGIWTLDALLQEAFGASPLFSLIDVAKHAISGHGMCTAEEVQRLDRLSGILGPCNLKLGLVLASLSPFVLDVAHKRWGLAGWLASSFALGLVILLAGSRASWITYALVLALSGWRALGLRKLAVVFALGAAFAVGLYAFSPQVRERFERTSAVLTADRNGVDVALSGRTRIWGAALCMIRQHPVNGVGARDFRDVFPACDRRRGRSRPGRGTGLPRAPMDPGGAQRNRRARPAAVDRRHRDGVARVALRPASGARPRAPTDDRAGGDAVPVQHPPRVLFHVLGRARAAARGAVRRQPARPRTGRTSAGVDVGAVRAAA